MRITHFYKPTSKAAYYMHRDADNAIGTIYDAYMSPSRNKVLAYNDIRNNYTHNDTTVLGVPCKTVIVPPSLNKLHNTMYMRYINGTYNVCAASSHFFSTVAIFEDVETDKRYLVKETHVNTYMCEL